ncbi:MAG: sugar ABC transporter permease [Candidatus Poribacteria bacterium]|nr:MAG: sugar ABC transporter permease [Candidatus Poribacteria bacterium]
MSRRRLWNRLLLVLAHLVLIAVAVAVLLPMIWLVASSFKTSGELFQSPPTFWPKEPTLENFRRLFVEVPFWRYFVNSVFLSTAATLASLFFSTLGGFGFAKYRFRGQGVLFGILLASMMIPFEVLLVPLFKLLRDIGWLDTYWGVVVPFMAGGFGIFLMRQFIVSVPDDLIDAARIDGCSEFGIYWRVVLPVIKPAVGALTIFIFLGQWNSYLWPLIVLRDDAKYTLPIGLANLIGVYQQEYGMLMAGTLIALIPIITLFLAMQREFVSGITLGAVKE